MGLDAKRLRRSAVETDHEPSLGIGVAESFAAETDVSAGERSTERDPALHERARALERHRLWHDDFAMLVWRMIVVAMRRRARRASRKQDEPDRRRPDRRARHQRRPFSERAARSPSQRGIACTAT